MVVYYTFHEIARKVLKYLTKYTLCVIIWSILHVTKKEQMEMEGMVRRTAIAATGLACSMFGPFDNLLRALIVFMAIDTITGISAAVTQKLSGKTEAMGL